MFHYNGMSITEEDSTKQQKLTFPGGGGDSHMKLTGMLVGKLELNP